MSKDNTIVSAAEITRNFGYWQQKALTEPLVITYHGRARVMLVSAEEFDRRPSFTPSSPVSSGLEELLANMQEIFVHYDANLRCVRTNAALERFAGVLERDVLGKTPTEISGVPQTILEEIMRRVLRTGEAEALEMESLRFPGRHLSARIIPYLGGVALIAINVTEQEKLRHDALAWTATRRALGQDAAVGWLRLDGRGRVAEASIGFTSLTGLPAEGVTSFRVFDLVVPADRRRLQTAFEDVMQKHSDAHVDIRLMQRNGKERAVRFAMAPILRDFNALGAMVVLTDRSLLEDTDTASAA